MNHHHVKASFGSKLNQTSTFRETYIAPQRIILAAHKQTLIMVPKILNKR